MKVFKLSRVLPIAAAIVTIALLAASCGGSSTTTTTTSAGSSVPKAGGTLNLFTSSDVLGFDEGYNAPWYAWTTHLTEDEMLNGDWTQGAAGTGQWTWTLDGIYNWSSKSGSLCESWQALAPNHYTFKVRQGVHFSLDPNNEASRLVNGREVTADDIVYSYVRLMTLPESYIVTAHPDFCKNTEMTATDKYSIDLVVPNDPDSIYQIAQIVVDWNGTIAKEVIDEWGDMKDWKHAHGTGAFILTDYVTQSELTFQKNPNYWDTDPIGAGKGNQLPYVDTVKFFIITDASAQQAALRTGQIDILNPMGGLGADDTEAMKQTTPELSSISLKAMQSMPQIFMRTDKPDTPFANKKVRQALIKAVDYKTLVNTLFGGDGSYPSFPTPPLTDLKDVVLPLSEASAEAQNLYVYDVDTAKQWLEEAGYGTGFQATIQVQNTPANIDYLAAIKQMWEKINVELTIEPLEYGVYMNRWVARDYDEMFFGIMASPGTFRSMVSSQGSGGGYNLSYITDDRLADAKIEMMDLFTKGDDAGVATVHREVCNYIYENAWAVTTPAGTGTIFWWPWVKNFHGESAVGILNTNGWTKWVWIDQTLKTSMGH